jgi:hypothetical protein
VRAEVINLYAWDVAHEIAVDAVRRSITAAGEGVLRPEKAAPRDVMLEKFLRVPMGADREGGHEIDVRANIYAFGVVAITLRYRVDVASLGELVAHHSPDLDGGLTMDALCARRLGELLDRIRPFLVRPEPGPGAREAYTAFRLSPEDLALADATEWISSRGREVAALLVNEKDPSRLSAAQVAETLRHQFSYYRDELLVVDWDAALIVDRGPAEDVLAVLELAHLQLVEFRHYDHVLDVAVTRAYDDVDRFTRRPIFFGAGDLVRDLREIRISLSEVADEVENATKFFGDWHLARVYLGCSTRFHLPAWKAAVEEKLRTLDELYNLASSESSNRKMLVLELIIVLLFIIDLVALALASSR